jgi:hypothetical protein
MKALILGILFISGITLASQSMQRVERLYTNPNTDGYVKALFPQAVTYLPESSPIPHFNAYASDPKANPKAAPIGFMWWTTDLDPWEVGYHGPIRMFVGMDLTGTLTGVIVDWDTEPYGSFSVEPPKFGGQFKGKKITDPFRVGGDVDAVSRASISINSATRAVRDTSRLVAKHLLAPPTTTPTK